MDRHHVVREPGVGMLESVEVKESRSDGRSDVEEEEKNKTQEEQQQQEEKGLLQVENNGGLVSVSFLDARNYPRREERECSRWSGYSETLPSLQLLDVLQESTTLLRKHNGLLGVLAVVLSLPLSAIVLSHVLLGFPFIQWLVREVELMALKNFQNLGNRIMFRRVAEILISYIVNIPFTAIFSPLLKAGVAYIVACTYGGKKPTFADIWEMLKKFWPRLMQTFVWSCSIFLVLAVAFASVLMYASSAGSTSSFVVTVGVAASAVLAISLCVGLAFVSVLSSLAYVVTVLEGLHGVEALIKSLYYLTGKMHVALLLFLVTNVNGTLLDILFELHIIASTDPSTENLLSKMWEAPLLVLMHSFVYLFDAIMMSVFYYICKSEEPENLESHLAEDGVTELDSLVRTPI